MATNTQGDLFQTNSTTTMTVTQAKSAHGTTAENVVDVHQNEILTQLDLSAEQKHSIANLHLSIGQLQNLLSLQQSGLLNTTNADAYIKNIGDAQQNAAIKASESDAADSNDNQEGTQDNIYNHKTLQAPHIQINAQQTQSSKSETHDANFNAYRYLNTYSTQQNQQRFEQEHEMQNDQTNSEEDDGTETEHRPIILPAYFTEIQTIDIYSPNGSIMLTLGLNPATGFYESFTRASNNVVLFDETIAFQVSGTHYIYVGDYGHLKSDFYNVLGWGSSSNLIIFSPETYYYQYEQVNYKIAEANLYNFSAYDYNRKPLDLFYTPQNYDYIIFQGNVLENIGALPYLQHDTGTYYQYGQDIPFIEVVQNNIPAFYLNAGDFQDHTNGNTIGLYTATNILNYQNTEVVTYTPQGTTLYLTSPRGLGFAIDTPYVSLGSAIYQQDVTNHNQYNLMSVDDTAAMGIKQGTTLSFAYTGIFENPDQSQSGQFQYMSVENNQGAPLSTLLASLNGQIYSAAGTRGVYQNLQYPVDPSRPPFEFIKVLDATSASILYSLDAWYSNSDSTFPLYDKVSISYLDNTPLSVNLHELTPVVLIANGDSKAYTYTDDYFDTKPVIGLSTTTDNATTINGTVPLFDVLPDIYPIDNTRGISFLWKHDGIYYAPIAKDGLGDNLFKIGDNYYLETIFYDKQITDQGSHYKYVAYNGLLLAYNAQTSSYRLDTIDKIAFQYHVNAYFGNTTYLYQPGSEMLASVVFLDNKALQNVATYQWIETAPQSGLYTPTLAQGQAPLNLALPAALIMNPKNNFTNASNYDSLYPVVFKQDSSNPAVYAQNAVTFVETPNSVFEVGFVFNNTLDFYTLDLSAQSLGQTPIHHYTPISSVDIFHNAYQVYAISYDVLNTTHAGLFVQGLPAINVDASFKYGVAYQGRFYLLNPQYTDQAIDPQGIYQQMDANNLLKIDGQYYITQSNNLADGEGLFAPYQYTSIDTSAIASTPSLDKTSSNTDPYEASSYTFTDNLLNLTRVILMQSENYTDKFIQDPLSQDSSAFVKSAYIDGIGHYVFFLPELKANDNEGIYVENMRGTNLAVIYDSKTYLYAQEQYTNLTLNGQFFDYSSQPIVKYANQNYIQQSHFGNFSSLQGQNILELDNSTPTLNFDPQTGNYKLTHTLTGALQNDTQIVGDMVFLSPGTDVKTVFDWNPTTKEYNAIPANTVIASNIKLNTAYVEQDGNIYHYDTASKTYQDTAKTYLEVINGLNAALYEYDSHSQKYVTSTITNFVSMDSLIPLLTSTDGSNFILSNYDGNAPQNIKIETANGIAIGIFSYNSGHVAYDYYGGVDPYNPLTSQNYMVYTDAANPGHILVDNLTQNFTVHTQYVLENNQFYQWDAYLNLYSQNGVTAFTSIDGQFYVAHGSDPHLLNAASLTNLDGSFNLQDSVNTSSNTYALTQDNQHYNLASQTIINQTDATGLTHTYNVYSPTTLLGELYVTGAQASTLIYQGGIYTQTTTSGFYELAPNHSALYAVGSSFYLENQMLPQPIQETTLLNLDESVQVTTLNADALDMSVQDLIQSYAEEVAQTSNDGLSLSAPADASLLSTVQSQIIDEQVNTYLNQTPEATLSLTSSTSSNLEGLLNTLYTSDALAQEASQTSLFSSVDQSTTLVSSLVDSTTLEHHLSPILGLLSDSTDTTQN